MDKKYQIFISSTYNDLKEERRKVQDTILSMYQFPIGMEMFSAADEEQWEIIKETIDSSDYYILIIAHRYGSTIESGEDVGISYTEKEYRYAKSLGIPVLAFIIDESVAVIPGNIEVDSEKKAKLDAFINDVKTGRIVEWWKTKEELAGKVTNSLNKQITRKKRPGWIRADNFNIEEIQKELIEMSKKIRSLETENTQLKKQRVVRKPELSININDETVLKLPFYEEEVSCNMSEFSHLTINDVPLQFRQVVTQEKLDKYNKSLPNTQQIEEYKRQLQLFYMIKNHSTDIKITVDNEGTLKAKDIYIDLEFPKEIQLYTKKAIEDLQMPKKPITEENPIEKCYRNNPLIKAQALFPQTERLWNTGFINRVDAKDRHFINGENEISIRMQDLLNGYMWNIEDEYCIVPMQKGTFEIECSLMCEEYIQVEKKIIKVIVE